MYNFKTIRCSSCGSVLINLPASELVNLNGQLMHCDGCERFNLIDCRSYDSEGKIKITDFSFRAREEEPILMC